MIKSSHKFIKFFIIGILSSTFAPPNTIVVFGVLFSKK